MPYSIPQDNYDVRLTQSLEPGAVTAYVSNLPTETSGVVALYEQDGVTLRELMYYAGIASGPNRLTGLERELALTATAGVYSFSSGGDGEKHPVNTRLAMPSSSYYTGVALAILNGTMVTGGVMSYPASRTISASRHLTDKEYVDAAAASAGGITAFMVSQNGADPSLTVNVGAGRWMLNDTMQTYAGAAAQAVQASQTNYVQLKYDGTLVINTTGFVVGNLPLAEVVTDGTDITSITDRRSWLTLGMPKFVISTEFTYGGTIAAGDPLYIDTAASNKLKKALASGAGTADVRAIAIDAGSDTDTGKRVILSGIVTGLSGLTGGKVYLSDTGTLAASTGTFKKVVGFAYSATAMIFAPVPGPEDLAGGNASATLANFNELMTLIANTDITASELETLSAGVASNADSLHTHSIWTLFYRSMEAGYITLIGDQGDLLVNTGSVDRDYMTSQFATSAGTANQALNANLNAQISSIDWDNDCEFVTLLKQEGTGYNQYNFIGINANDIKADVPNGGTDTARHVGFYFVDSVVYASVANGTTQTRTDISSGITLTDKNVYRFVKTAAQVLFYVNGTLKATISTNVPTGSANMYLTFAFERHTSGDNVYYIANDYMFRIKTT